MSLHELTPEQQEIRALTRRFADEKIAPHAAAWDRDHHFPRELFAELGELGLMGVCVPVEQGGAGADFLAYIQVLEELSRADAGRRRHRRGPHERVHAAAARPRLSRTCPALAAGEEIGAFALTEAGSGSDAARCAPATRDGAHHRRQAVDHQRLLRRRPSSSSRARGRAHQRVRRAAAPTASRSRARRTSSGSTPPRPPTSSFEDTPAERLGEPGKGMSIALRTLDAGRIGIAAQAVGIGQAALDLATAYAKERNAFGGPIAKLGAIQQKLADMQTEVEAARALTWRAARLKDAGRPHTVEGAQAKLFASGVARAPDRRGDPGPRRLRLHEGVPGRALLPRRQGDRDLRGDLRDPAARDRAGAAGRGDARVSDEPVSRSRAPRRGRRGWPSTTRDTDGIWIKFAKKASGIPTVVYAEAVDVALCYGWIDGQTKRARRRLVHPALHAAARAQPLVEDQPREGGGADRERRDAAGGAGRGRAREGRRALGRRLRRAEHGDGARTTCARRSTATVRRASFFETLDAQNRYAILHRLQDAKKPETRARRIEKFVAMLEPRRDDLPDARAVAAHLRVDAAFVHRAPAPGAVAAAVEEQPPAVAAHLQPREPVGAAGGRPRRPRSATAGGRDDARSTPSSRPRSSPRGPRRRARRVGT